MNLPRTLRSLVASLALVGVTAASGPALAGSHHHQHSHSHHCKHQAKKVVKVKAHRVVAHDYVTVVVGPSRRSFRRVAVRPGWTWVERAWYGGVWVEAGWVPVHAVPTGTVWVPGYFTDAGVWMDGRFTVRVAVR